MIGIWLENQTLSIRDDLPIPAPGPGEALVRMRLAGVCRTDLELCKGYYPFRGVPGHEFTGQVVEAPGSPEWIGKRAVGDINISCGQCEPCLSGRPHHCLYRKTLGINQWDGCFAEYFTLPVCNLYPVEEGIQDESAVFSEPLAAALEIQQQVHIHAGMRVLVIGAGRLGLLTALSLSLTGCDLSVVARRPRSQAILRERGIPYLAAGDIPPHRADVVVEVTGSPDGFDLARRAVRPAGTIVLKSTFKGDVQLNLSSLVVDEVTLVGSRCGSHPAALHLLQEKAVDSCPLVDAIYPLSAGLTAFEHASRPGALKILLRP
jgi:threonine dehydrogenase-like Zn-dependent dehydrogenase